MPIPIPDAALAGAETAATKALASRNSLRFGWSSVLAGAYVGLAVVLLVAVSAPLAAVDHPLTKLVQAAVFGLALTLVVFAGAELFTGNAMVMTQGVLRRSATAADLGRVWGLSLAGNIVGSILLAAVVHAGGSLGDSGRSLVASIVDTKDGLTGGQLFWRSVLCNLLVCLALWMASRASTDGAKVAVLWWALLAFIASGFEHSVANVTVFSLGVFDGSATWAELGRNLLWTVPGNIVGGALLMGAGYAWLGSAVTVRTGVDGVEAAVQPVPDGVEGAVQPVPDGVEGAVQPVAVGASR